MSKPVLPNLPGYNVQINQNQNFRKYKRVPQPQISQDTTDEKHQPIPTEIVAPAPKLPSWVAFARMVLRFYAYFKESVTESHQENFRVRTCTLCYFLEDDSMIITEPRGENSGIPQGSFLKRHRVPKPQGGYFSPTDFSIGAELNIYGRVFKIVDADPFTRTFYHNEGIELAPAEDLPLDSFHAQLSRKAPPRLMHGMMQKEPDKLRQFLEYDGHVLRFYCTWDDKTLYGEQREYILHFFLANDNVEVLEVKASNSGRDPFPALLKRGKLPKKLIAMSSAIGAAPVPQFYAASDFRPGCKVDVYGREFVIVDCDDFTRNYLKENFGLKDADFPQPQEEETSEEKGGAEAPPPPYTGFGSEEDSLTSCRNLVPKPPRRDLRKLMAEDQNIFHFLSKLDTAKPEDVDRRFIITFFKADDTLSVFEKQQRNSGFVGGKFLERSRVKNPETNNYFQSGEFFVGGKVTINNHVFVLLESDEFTLNHMESLPEQYPHSNYGAIIEQVKSAFRSAGKTAQQLFKQTDSNKDSLISLQEFKTALASLNVPIVEHDIITVFRHLDKNRSGTISLFEFAHVLAH